MTVSKEAQAGKVGEVCINVPNYKKLIIEMIQDIDKSEDKFLIQIYTIIHRHIEKRGR